jgi:hypothetical protein
MDTIRMEWFNMHVIMKQVMGYQETKKERKRTNPSGEVPLAPFVEKKKTA